MSHHSKSSGILLRAILSKGKYLLTLAVSLLAAIGFTIYINRTGTLDDYWANILDPLIGMGTIILAVLIWFDVVRKEYQQNLPKRLSVLYKIKIKIRDAENKVKEHPIMYYHKAYLSGEDDIRPWAQQLVYQANDRIGLLFTAFFNLLHEVPQKDESWVNGIKRTQSIMLYLLEFHLTGGYLEKDIPPFKVKDNPIVLEKRFKDNGKDYQKDTLIYLTLDGGKTETEVFRSDLTESINGIPQSLQTEILEALAH